MVLEEWLETLEAVSVTQASLMFQTVRQDEKEDFFKQLKTSKNPKDSMNTMTPVLEKLIYSVVC